MIFCVSLITLTVNLVFLSVVPISLSIQFNLAMCPLVTEIRDGSSAPPNGHLTILQRAAIIKMHQEGNSQATISHTLGHAPQTIRTWIERFKATGDVVPLRSGGRKPLMTATTQRRAFELLTSTENHHAGQVAVALHREGLVSSVPSRHTVARGAHSAAREAGVRIQCVRGQPGKALSVSNKAARLEFARVNKNTNWATVMFTDRKRFEFKFPGVKVSRSKWVVRGESWQAQQVNHPQSVNLYAGFTIHGMTAAHIVTGTSKVKSGYVNKKGEPAKNITSAEYMEVIQRTLLPEGKKMFSANGQSTWIFQQDNDPTHKMGAKWMTEWMMKSGCSLRILVWPPNSPDLSPIENIWGIVDSRVRARGCSTFEEFKAAVLDELKSVSKSTLVKLSKSMKDRLEMVVKKGGDRISY